MNHALNFGLLGAAIAGAVLTYTSAISIELFMLLLLVVSGIVSLLDRFSLRAKRAKEEKEPLWVEYSRSFFPVILIVFLLRSFLVEPFQIPSGSMTPTLLEGDFILVNKYTYGIRLPVADIKVFEVNNPRRGDVMVFRYPNNTSMNFIKRVVGVPGDVVEYRDNKQLTINGVVQQLQQDGEYDYMKTVKVPVDGGYEAKQVVVHTQRYTESLNGHPHPVLFQQDRPFMNVVSVENFPFRENCSYTETSMRCTVPPGYYFMMGDNRDDSHDSRYWGFVQDKLIVGKAFVIWMNWENLKHADFKRIGLSVN